MRSVLNKKGDLTNETLSIIVAVIGVSLLLFGVWKLYGALANSERENAKNVLNALEDKINAIQDGEEGKILLQGFKGAENWYLVGWSKDEKGKPEKCFFDSCICVCKDTDDYLNLRDGGKSVDSSEFSYTPLNEDCQEEGICKMIEIDSINLEEVVGKAKGGIFGTGETEYYNYPFMQVKTTLFEITVSKKNPGVIILNHSREGFEVEI